MSEKTRKPDGPSDAAKPRKRESIERHSPLKEIFGFAEQQKPQMILAVVLGVVSSLGGLVPYVAVACVLSEYVAGTLSVAACAGYALVAFSGYAIKAVLYAASTMTSHKATYRILRTIRCAIMDRMARAPMGEIRRRGSGAYKQLIIDDVDKLEYPLAHVIPEVTAAVVLILSVVGYLLYVHWAMAIAAVASTVAGLLVYSRLTKGRGALMAEYLQANMTMNATIVEYVQGMEVIKAFNRTASSLSKLTESVERTRDLITRWYRHCWPYIAGSGAIMPSAISFTLPVGALLYLLGQLDLVQMIVCIVLSLGLVGAIRSIQEFGENLATIMEVEPKIHALLVMPELPERADPVPFSPGEVVFDHVRFGYGAESAETGADESPAVSDWAVASEALVSDSAAQISQGDVLHDLSFTCKANSMTALVGPSGSGKSTCARLVARFWDVRSGSVSIGGVDVRDVAVRDLMEQVSYVSQDAFLFDRTLRENIRIGNPAASDAEVEAAADAAACRDFLARLPHGLDTPAGEAGGLLSGGEKQRIAIARAFLKDAPVVILDEATAHADPESEDVVQRSIDALVAGKTLIVVAHRLTTVMRADKIVVIDDGRLSAEGTHEELLAHSDLYRRMWHAHREAMDWTVQGDSPSCAVGKEARPC